VTEYKVRTPNLVCIPRPLERADGGPLQYRVAHHLKLGKPGETPNLQQTIVEGDIPPGASRDFENSPDNTQS